MPLAPYHDTIIDSIGRPVVSCNVAVLLQTGLGMPANTSNIPGSPLANVYAYANGTVQLSNPLGLNNGVDPLGNLDFYVDSGNYYTLQFYGPPIFQQLIQEDVVVGTGYTTNIGTLFTETITITANANVGHLSFLPTNFISLSRNDLNQRTPQDFQINGTNVTINLSAFASDTFYATYFH